MNTSSRTVEHLVIGGGPAGSMVALRLAQAGQPVTLLEKERAAHHKVCGEFLSGETAHYLRDVGLSPQGLGATSIQSVRLSAGGRAAQAPLPFRALSLSRRVLDDAMLERAAQEGCEVLRGAFVMRLVREHNLWVATLNDGSLMRARTVFLATGKHDLHGWNRKGGRQCDLVGFKLHWQLKPMRTEELHEAMELFLFPGGYGGLSLVEGEVANLCLVARRAELRRQGEWSQLFTALLKANRRLRSYFEGARALWARPLAISPIPYGYLADQPDDLWRVGDQVAVIPSFTGDGISIAMHSASLAAQMYLAGKHTEEYSQALRAQLNRGMSLAVWISRSMVTRAGRDLARFGLSLFPGAMQWMAASTRVPERALLVRNGAFLSAGK